MKTTDYNHLKPILYTLEQSIALLVVIVMGISIPLLLILAIALDAFSFVLMALMVLFLIAPVLMLMSITPPLTLSDEGITIRPRWWKAQHIRWEQIIAYKPYPLLPRSEQEIERRIIQGRKRYERAIGKMLVVKGLPFQYRMGGIFVGEHGQTVIAMTNRTHQSYDKLIKQLESRLKRENLLGDSDHS